jgi:hypothetical protein
MSRDASLMFPDAMSKLIHFLSVLASLNGLRDHTRVWEQILGSE